MILYNLSFRPKLLPKAHKLSYFLRKRGRERERGREGERERGREGERERERELE